MQTFSTVFSSMRKTLNPYPVPSVANSTNCLMGNQGGGGTGPPCFWALKRLCWHSKNMADKRFQLSVEFASIAYTPCGKANKLGDGNGDGDGF